jgi:branched-subunit amino acid transport system permease
VISAQPTAGIGYELDAIAAVVLGGTSLFGGRGRLHGTLIGSVILGVLSTGLILMNVQFFTQLLIHSLKRRCRPTSEHRCRVAWACPSCGVLDRVSMSSRRSDSGTHWPHPIAL